MSTLNRLFVTRGIAMSARTRTAILEAATEVFQPPPVVLFAPRSATAETVLEHIQQSLGSPQSYSCLLWNWGDSSIAHAVTPELAGNSGMSLINATPRVIRCSISPFLLNSQRVSQIPYASVDTLEGPTDVFDVLQDLAEQWRNAYDESLNSFYLKAAGKRQGQGVIRVPGRLPGDTTWQQIREYRAQPGSRLRAPLAVQRYFEGSSEHTILPPSKLYTPVLTPGIVGDTEFKVTTVGNKIVQGFRTETGRHYRWVGVSGLPQTVKDVIKRNISRRSANLSSPFRATNTESPHTTVLSWDVKISEVTQKAYVLEVNSAPGVNAHTAKRILRAVAARFGYDHQERNQ